MRERLVFLIRLTYWGRRSRGDESFGYATDETRHLNANTCLSGTSDYLSSEVRKNGSLSYLGAGWKSAVSVNTKAAGRCGLIPWFCLHNIYRIFCHGSDWRGWLKRLHHSVIPKEIIGWDTRYYINPTGRFVRWSDPQGIPFNWQVRLCEHLWERFARHGGIAFRKRSSEGRPQCCLCCTYVANIIGSGVAHRCEEGSNCPRNRVWQRLFPFYWYLWNRGAAGCTDSGFG